MDIKKFCVALPRRGQQNEIAEPPPRAPVAAAAAASGEDEVDAAAAAEEVQEAVQAMQPILPPVPYQPASVDCVPVQRLAKRTLRFQRAWFEMFPWLHFDAVLGGVLCFTCTKAERSDLADMARCADHTFTSKGFCNWKKAIEKFRSHEKTPAHLISHINLRFRATSNSVNVQLGAHHLEEQRQARQSLLKIITSMQFIAQQGLAVRGKEATDGNFVKLLELRSDDDDVLKRWLTRTTSYTSVTVQNEILRIMAHMVLRDICNDIRYFAVIVDGTQDIQGVEQESICVRYVDDAYHVHEDFVGLYNVEDTTGASLSHMFRTRCSG